MNNVKKLTKIKIFLQKALNVWKRILIIASIFLLISGIIVLFVVNKQTLFYKIVLAVFASSIAALLFLLVACILVPILDFKIRGERAWFNWSSSRILPLLYRIKTTLELNELKNHSDYRFFNQNNTYLRVQILSKYLTFADSKIGYRQDAFGAFPKPKDKTQLNTFKYDNGTDIEILTLCIESKTYENTGEVEVCAKLIAKENPSPKEIMAAESVPIFLEEPTFITYGFNRIGPDGKTEELDEILVSITWIGGNT